MSLVLAPRPGLSLGRLDGVPADRARALASELAQVAHAPREKRELRAHEFAPELLDVVSWCRDADPDDVLLRVLDEPGYAGVVAAALHDLAKTFDASRSEDRR